MSFDEAEGDQRHSGDGNEADQNDQQMLLGEGIHAQQHGRDDGQNAARLCVLFRGRWHRRRWGLHWCDWGRGRYIRGRNWFWRISGLPCESGRDLTVHFGQHLQDSGAAGLLIHGRLAEDVIGHIFSAAILGRETPQIGAVAFPEVAPAVVFLGLVKDALDGPCRHLVETVRRHGERINRGGFPR
jgi:hypothetical protein